MKKPLPEPAAFGSTPHVLVIGDSHVDIACTQHTAGPMRPNGSTRGCVRYKRGGVARNSAENLALLGCICHLISVFGDDEQGRELMAATQLAGVDLSHCLVVSDATTATCLILNDHAGEMFFMMGDPGIVERLTPDWLATKSELFGNAALIVANTDLSEDALAWLFACHGDCPLFFDTVNDSVADRIRPWLRQVHTLKPNRREASLLSGLPFNSREEAPAVANWFHRAGVRHVILSLGAHGLYYSDGRQSGWMAPLPVDVIDVTGAGDALMAGLAYGYLHDLPFADSVAFGNACAALTLTTQANNHPELSAASVHALLRGPGRATAPGASGVQMPSRPWGRP